MLLLVGLCFVLAINGAAEVPKPTDIEAFVDHKGKRETYAVLLEMKLNQENSDPIIAIIVQYRRTDNVEPHATTMHLSEQLILAYWKTKHGKVGVEIEGYFPPMTIWQFFVKVQSASGAQSDMTTVHISMPSTGRDLGNKCSNIIEQHERYYNNEKRAGGTNPKLEKPEVWCVHKTGSRKHKLTHKPRYELHGQRVLLQNFCDQSEDLQWQLEAFLPLSPDGKVNDFTREYGQCMNRMYERECRIADSSGPHSRWWHAQIVTSDDKWAPFLLALDYIQDTTDTTKEEAKSHKPTGYIAPSFIDLRRSKYQSTTLHHTDVKLLQHLLHEQLPNQCTTPAPKPPKPIQYETCYDYVRRMEYENWPHDDPNPNPPNRTTTPFEEKIICQDLDQLPTKVSTQNIEDGMLASMFPDDLGLTAKYTKDGYYIRAYGKYIESGFTDWLESTLHLPSHEGFKTKMFVIMLPNQKIDAEYSRCKLRIWKENCVNQYGQPKGGGFEYAVVSGTVRAPYIILQCPSSVKPCNPHDFESWMIASGVLWFDKVYRGEWFGGYIAEAEDK